MPLHALSALSANHPLPPGRAIVVNDDRRMASGMAQWLCSLGWHASATGNADEAMQVLGRGACDVCVVDGLLPEHAGERLLNAVRSASPLTGMVVMLPPHPQGSASMGWATRGRSASLPTADAFVNAPVRDDELLAAIELACRAGRLRQVPESDPNANASMVLGDHATIHHVLDIVNRIANTPATVLITGESGTGKSLIAREIHRTSDRRRQRFVEVACGSLSESLLESELFGHVAGAFTGATADRDGKFRQADGGTIFLDEIATASPCMQVKLLRVLQDMQFEPVGGTDTHCVDARLILATHEDLAGLVAAGRFRDDLFWRINVVTPLNGVCLWAAARGSRLRTYHRRWPRAGTGSRRQARTFLPQAASRTPWPSQNANSSSTPSLATAGAGMRPPDRWASIAPRSIKNSSGWGWI